MNIIRIITIANLCLFAILAVASYGSAWRLDTYPFVSPKHGTAYPAHQMTLLSSDRNVIRTAAITAACQAIRGCKP